MAFLWSAGLWCLLALPVAALAYALLLRRRQRHVGRHPMTREVRDAMTGTSVVRRHLPACLLLVALAASIVACARPTIALNQSPARRTVMLALDISASMKATDVTPNRITAARNAVRTFVSGLSDDVRVGLVVFAGDAHLASSPTTNRRDFFEALDQVQLQMGTAIGSGLLTALDALRPEQGEHEGEHQPAPSSIGFVDRANASVEPAHGSVDREADGHRAGTIILFTDGVNTEGEDPLTAAVEAAGCGVRVYTVGVGTNPDEYLDEDTLRTIAHITGGRYFPARSADGLDGITRDIAVKLEAEHRGIEVTAVVAGFAAMILIAACGMSLWCWRGVPAAAA